MRSWSYRRATVIRNHKWLGIGLGDNIATLWGAAMDLAVADKLRGRLHSWINNQMFLSSYDLSPRVLNEHVKSLNQFKPRLLISYPGPLSVFAEYLLATGQRIPNIKALICSAETLYPWQRELIEKAFECRLFNRYGCREFGDIAQECSKRKGLHLHTDRIFLEIVDQYQKPVKDGVSGELVLTDLDNYGFPLIRYRIGDVGVMATDLCSCGINLPLLANIEGRTLDVVKCPNGNRLGGTFWTLLFRSKPGIKSFQVLQENIEGVTIKYVKDSSTVIDFSYFSNKIKEKCGMDIKIIFTEVAEIKKTKSGKTRFVISKLL
jgi:phenylacetate-CoA ligase